MFLTKSLYPSVFNIKQQSKTSHFQPRRTTSSVSQFIAKRKKEGSEIVVEKKNRVKI